MPSCSFACRRAVQRKLPKPSDTIWISEDVLHHTFQRFARFSTTTKRHGNFVPGPLEARRRLGKRRMAYASKSTPTSPFQLEDRLWNMWNEFWQDRTIFQWEAPTARSSTPQAPVNEHIPSLAAQPSPSAQTSEFGGYGKQKTWMWVTPVDVTLFQESIYGTKSSTTDELCLAFNIKLAEAIKLQTISLKTLELIVSKDVTENMRNAIEDPVQFEQRCLGLYKTVWGAISTCEANQHTDPDGVISNQILYRLSEMPITGEVQATATSLIRSASISQRRIMGKGLHQLICALAQSWSSNLEPTDAELRSVDAAEATTATLRAGHQLLDLRGLVTSLHHRPINSADITKAREASESIRFKILKARAAFGKARESNFPVEHSVTELATALATISKRRYEIWRIIEPCSHRIANLLKDMPEESASRLKYHWLSLISDLTPRHWRLFVEAWQILEPSGGSLDESIASTIILRDWVNRKLIKRPYVVQNAWKSIPNSHRKLSTLVTLLGNHGSLCHYKAYNIIAVLSALGKSAVIPQLIYAIQGCGIRFHWTARAKILRRMTLLDHHAAFEVYNILKGDTYYLPHCPEFVVSLIQDIKLRPQLIWDIIGIPSHRTSRPKGDRLLDFSNDRLSQDMKDLLREMASAFSQAEHLRPRVAMRNVVNCLVTMRASGERLPTSMIRSLTHAAITRELLDRGCVSRERLAWVIKWIRNVEGEDVGVVVDVMIHRWLMYHNKLKSRIEKKRRALEGNFAFGTIG